MLKALSMGHENKISPGRRGAGPAVEPQNAQDRFHSFVYRLAYICANNVGSDTITSVAVMETEGSFSYLFACNQVSAEEGKRISKHIEALLRKVATANQSRGNPGTRCQDEVLKRILRFNRLRIEAYLKRIFQHATKCLEGHQAVGDQGIDWTRAPLNHMSVVDRIVRQYNAGEFGGIDEIPQRDDAK